MICWDRGRPARKRAEGAQSFKIALNLFSRFALICGRDARGPSNTLKVLNFEVAEFQLSVAIADIRCAED